MLRKMMLIAASMMLIAASMTLLAAAGCSSWSTYPPVETSVARTIASPLYEPVPTLMTRAVAWAHEHQQTVSPLVFNLPEGTPADVYAIAIQRLGEGAPMTHADQLAYHVTNVRVRGAEAEVDVVLPRSDGVHELVTLQFDRPAFERWSVTGTRHWRIRVSTPEPRYVADPDVELPVFHDTHVRTDESQATMEQSSQPQPVIVAPEPEPAGPSGPTLPGVHYEGEKSIDD